MKKLLLIAVLALATQGLHAQDNAQDSTVPAQTRTTRLPGHEWTINGFGGISTLGYSVDGASLKRGIGGGAGFGFHWFFNDRWSLITGLEAALYKASLSADPMYSGQYFKLSTTTPNGTYTEEMVMRHRLAGFREEQSVWALQLPLMAQWMAPLGAAQNHHFYLALGARLGFSLSGAYSQSASGIDYMVVEEYSLVRPDYVEWWPAGTYNPDQTFTPATLGAGKQTLKFAAFNAMASAEAGVRWKLGEYIGLYTGLYVDYGFLNIAPEASGEALYMPFESGDEGYPSEYTGARNNSVLTAHQPDYGEWVQQQAKWTQNEARYADKVNTLGAGLKIKIAFGGPKRKPAPAPAAVPPPAPAPEPEPEPVIEQPAPEPAPEPVKEVPQVIKKAMMDLSNTLFAFDRFNLSAEAIAELDKVAAWLNENPEIHVEIEGHTDSFGTEEYNQRLSEERAKAVHDYFTQHGVGASRLSYRGYGLTRPIAGNSTEEGRRQNRRVELRIVEPVTK